VLARADADRLKQIGGQFVDALGALEVLESRTGLVMLPMRDTARGTSFHLGEVLVAQAHIRSGEQQGYGMRTGRDLEAAMAMALLDLAWTMNVSKDRIAAFVRAEDSAQQAEDETTLRRVEATRIDMETF
tara:strand:+ start:827 stop:1216 length:390 start_codon:yes stop_codon:yes gene_type:complete